MSPTMKFKESRFLLVSRLVLAILFVGFYGYIVIAVTNRPIAWPDGVKDVVLFLLGALTSCVVTVVGFFFNSSQSSAAKDAMLLQSKPMTESEIENA